MPDYTSDDFEDELTALILKARDNNLLPHEVVMELKYKALQMEHAFYAALIIDHPQQETH